MQQSESTAAMLSSSKWRDVTNFIKTTTREEFAIGEMAHGPTFSLSEILSAIEIMDPKMDTFLNGPKGEYVFFPKERFERGLVTPINELSILNLLSMMDDFLSAVVGCEFTPNYNSTK